MPWLYRRNILLWFEGHITRKEEDEESTTNKGGQNEINFISHVDSYLFNDMIVRELCSFLLESV